MHWYNPEEGKVEDVRAPSTDEEALGVEQALVFVGRSLRMFRPRHLNLGRTREPQRFS